MNKIMGILLLLVYVCAATALLSPNFATPYNLYNIIRYTAFYGIIGIGVSFVIITGGIDLSIGSMIGLIGCILPMLLVERHWSIPAAIAGVMAIAVALGLVHGLLVTKLRLQPFIVTLCGLLIYRGVARWLTSDQTKGFGTDYDATLRLLATGKPCTFATLLLAGGVLLGLWGLWRMARRRAEPGEVGASFGLNLALLVMGATLIVVGSSRFWEGGEFQFSGPIAGWKVTVPDSAATAPQEWMQTAKWGVMPAAAWLLLVTVPRRPAAMIPPLSLSAIGGGLVAAAYLTRPDELTNRQMASIFLSLGVLIAGLGWLSNRALKVGGPSALPPLILSGFFASLGLFGQVQLAETLVPAPFLFLLGIAALASVFMNQTIYGRYLLALGRNEEAARYSGIETGRMVILAYVLCAALSGVGGILFALDGNSVQPAGHGNFLELYAIAAAVLGGCSLRGGEGTVFGVIIGAAVMRVLYNSINILRIPSQLEFAIIGAVILFGVLADELVKRIAARKKPVVE